MNEHRLLKELFPLLLLLFMLSSSFWDAHAKNKGKRVKKVPLPPMIRLPKSNLKKFNVRIWRIKRRKKSSSIDKKRRRPPTRGGDSRRSLLHLTKETLGGPKEPSRSIRAVKRQDITIERKLEASPRQHIRFVVYQQKWLYKKWTRRWVGHIIIYKDHFFYQTPNHLQRNTLKRVVQTFLKRTGRKIREPKFAWFLRRYLERQEHYEIEIQFPQNPPNHRFYHR